MRREIGLIAAMDRNRVIGAGGALPWHLPADLKWFRRCTVGKPVIMGRRTWESLGGRALPERPNIVLTTHAGFEAPGATVANGLEAALAAAGEHEEVMVIGGAVVFDATIHLADRLYLTVVDAEFEGDTWFPVFDTGEWRETLCEPHDPDERNPWPYTFLVCERTGA